MGCDTTNQASFDFVHRLINDDAFYQLAQTDPAQALIDQGLPASLADDIVDGGALISQAELAAHLATMTVLSDASSQVIGFWVPDG